MDIGIARTQPCYNDRDEVREAEALFLDSIDAAEHSIYIENQFVTSAPIARRLAKRLRERRKLEVLIVAPHRHESWVEVEDHAQRPHPFLAHGAEGRRRPRAFDVSACRGRQGRHHKP